MFVKIALLTLLTRIFRPYRKWVTVTRIPNYYLSIDQER
jgi:hypothetical protein